VTIGAIATSTNGLSTFTVVQQSGPGTATVAAANGVGFNTSLSDTLRAVITPTVAGNYAFKFTVTDKAGNSMSGVDSLVVSAVPTTTITITAVTITLMNGMTITLPPGAGTKVTVNGQNVTF